MNNPWKLIFVILFICQEITAAQPSNNNSTKYDLTNVLNDAILRLFKGSDFFEKLESQRLINHLIYRNNVYKINNYTQKLRPYGNTINIRRKCRYGSSSSFSRNTTHHWEFAKNTFHMFYGELNTYIVGHAQVEEPCSYWNCSFTTAFAVDHDYKNFSIIATKMSANSSYNENIFINTSYDHLENVRGIILIDHSKLSYKQHLKLIYIIGLELPSIMRYFSIDDGNFKPLLGEVFNLHPKQYVISARPDFSTNEQRYYYLLPDVPLILMSFKNITVRGLSNFESYVNQKVSNDLVYTLHVKNVGGSMTLESIFEHLPHLQLNFFIRDFSISFVPKNDEFRVEAQNYSIVEDTPQSTTLISSWVLEYSTRIIQFIESAMADSLMPSKKDKEKSSSLPSDFSQIETSFVELVKKSHPRTR